MNDTPQLFLDCDGVLADFDTAALKIFGIPPRAAEEKLGAPRFWVDLSTTADFYLNLPLMPDAMELYEAVKHLNPIILTGCPEGGWAEAQKQAWAAKHFPGVKMITCKSRNKRDHMKPGDILVDDWPKYQELWRQAGGHFILHSSAKDSISQLTSMGIRAHVLESLQTA